MNKFDTSCGLKKNHIYIIKYSIRNEILKHLPILPESIETKLFFEGRDAWIYNWILINQKPIDSKEEIALDVVVKLKREFHHCIELTHYRFSCMVKLMQDIYRPKVSIIKKVQIKPANLDVKSRSI